MNMHECPARQVPSPSVQRGGDGSQDCVAQPGPSWEALVTEGSFGLFLNLVILFYFIFLLHHTGYFSKIPLEGKVRERVLKVPGHCYFKHPSTREDSKL